MTECPCMSFTLTMVQFQFYCRTLEKSCHGKETNNVSFMNLFEDETLDRAWKKLIVECITSKLCFLCIFLELLRNSPS